MTWPYGHTIWWIADLTYVRTWSRFVRIDEFHRVHHRCLLARDRRLASRPIIEIRSRLRCVRAGDLDTQRLCETGAVNSVGSRGDSYDNALAESIDGLYKTALVRNKGPWRGLDDLELPTLEWVDWFNFRRLFEAH